MRRWVFNLCACCSLLLMLGTTGMWIRSYYTRDMVSWVSEGNGHIMQSILGRVHVMSSLDGNSSGQFTHREDKLVPNALWNGAMSGYPLTVNWKLGHVWQRYQRQHYDHFAGGTSG